MPIAQSLAGVLGVSVVSGVNLYLTVLVLGLGQRLGWIQGLPGDLKVLGNPLVLVVAGLLFLLEFLADKVPFVTPFWDALHTFIRPVGGALLALGAASGWPPETQVLALLAGGTLALGTHGAKMGARLMAHATPEPATHSLISLAEDLGVIALLLLCYRHPWIALPVLGSLIAALAWLLPRALRALRMLGAGVAGKLQAALAPPPRGPALPLWAQEALLGWGDHPPAVVPAYARRLRGAPRFRRGYLARRGGAWRFVFRRWFRTRSVDLEGPTIHRAVLWDTCLFPAAGRPQALLVSKAWSPLLEA